jgi:hypothetical protein
MKCGLMYEIQIPEPHYPDIEQERYKQVMAQVELADAGVDQVLCFMQMGNLPHSRVMDSMKLFGKYVIPYFQ